MAVCLVLEDIQNSSQWMHTLVGSRSNLHLNCGDAKSRLCAGAAILTSPGKCVSGATSHQVGWAEKNGFLDTRERREGREEEKKRRKRRREGERERGKRRKRRKREEKKREEKTITRRVEE